MLSFSFFLWKCLWVNKTSTASPISCRDLLLFSQIACIVEKKQLKEKLPKNFKKLCDVTIKNTHHVNFLSTQSHTEQNKSQIYKQQMHHICCANCSDLKRWKNKTRQEEEKKHKTSRRVTNKTVMCVRFWTQNRNYDLHFGTESFG